VCYFHLNDELESLTGQICLSSLDGKDPYIKMLKGTIPSELVNLRSLKELWLGKFFICCFGIGRNEFDSARSSGQFYVTSQQSSHTHTIDRSN